MLLSLFSLFTTTSTLEPDGVDGVDGSSPVLLLDSGGVVCDDSGSGDDDPFGVVCDDDDGMTYKTGDAGMVKAGADEDGRDGIQSDNMSGVTPGGTTIGTRFATGTPMGTPTGTD